MDPTEPTANSAVQTVRDRLEEHDYLSDEGIATAIYLAMELERPLLLEGDAGVGKTEVAKTLSRWLQRPLLRLQCYEGLDINQSVYEWDYARQLLHLRMAEGRADGANEDELYSERFLIRRPILQAIDPPDGVAPILLIDELDRADDEFEAFLLEVLSDHTVSIPELGTFTARQPPLIVITSNRTRDLHDALKRRCIYHWVPHPDLEREIAIVERRAGVGRELATEIARAVEQLRTVGLYKPPGAAESIDWARAVARLGRTTLDEHTARLTLGQVVKHREDQEHVEGIGLSTLLEARDSSAG